jgi:uncharacterized cupin superfamily protein
VSIVEVSDGVWTTKSGEERFEPDPEVGGSVHVLRDDYAVQAGIWAAPPPGDELNTEAFAFPHDETIYVLTGSVRIDIENGPTLELGPGDMASFRKGIRSVWNPSPDFTEFWVYA